MSLFIGTYWLKIKGKQNGVMWEEWTYLKLYLAHFLAAPERPVGYRKRRKRPLPRRWADASLNHPDPSHQKSRALTRSIKRDRGKTDPIFSNFEKKRSSPSALSARQTPDTTNTICNFQFRFHFSYKLSNSSAV